MKKFIFFPLWEIEEIEKYLESMEEKGYRLVGVRDSYWFYFKKSVPKQMCYFLTYKSFRGKSMGHCDYALKSSHSANPIETIMCFYNIYRTKERKENMSLLYGARLDFIRAKLLENALGAMFLTILFSAICVAALMAPSTMTSSIIYAKLCFLGAIIGICLYLTLYYFYGYFKQRNKCKKYERDNFKR